MLRNNRRISPRPIRVNNIIQPAPNTKPNWLEYVNTGLAALALIVATVLFWETHKQVELGQHQLGVSIEANKQTAQALEEAKRSNDVEWSNFMIHNRAEIVIENIEIQCKAGEPLHAFVTVSNVGAIAAQNTITDFVFKSLKRDTIPMNNPNMFMSDSTGTHVLPNQKITFRYWSEKLLTSDEVKIISKGVSVRGMVTFKDVIGNKRECAYIYLISPNSKRFAPLDTWSICN